MEIKDFIRLANNFYNQKQVFTDIERIALDAELFNYISSSQKNLPKKHKVAFIFICLNPLYWEYAREMVRGAKEFFLPGHETDFFFWTDIPEDLKVVRERIKEAWAKVPKNINMADPAVIARVEQVVQSINELRQMPGINFISTESVDWPYPTLLRYNLFLQEEEKLKNYDYIFYCDIDMQFVNIVGDEILGPGLTAALHPMYALDKKYWPPYEPNEKSTSYIKRPGRVISDNGNPRFMPMYFAGGFQGGKAKPFIKAMKECKKKIEKDLSQNYIPIWNDETAWNSYLSEHMPDVVLTPSYIYPDSLTNEYYIPLWGVNYQPKLKTLTKWFSTSPQGGQAVQQMINQYKKQ